MSTLLAFSKILMLPVGILSQNSHKASVEYCHFY